MRSLLFCLLLSFSAKAQSIVHSYTVETKEDTILVIHEDAWLGQKVRIQRKGILINFKSHWYFFRIINTAGSSNGSTVTRIHHTRYHNQLYQIKTLHYGKYQTVWITPLTGIKRRGFIFTNDSLLIRKHFN